MGRLRRVGLAVAVLAAMAVAGGVHSAASAATGAPFGGTAAAVPGTVQAANYDRGVGWGLREGQPSRLTCRSAGAVSTYCTPGSGPTCSDRYR